MKYEFKCRPLQDIALISSGKRPSQTEKQCSSIYNVPVVGGGGVSSYTTEALFTSPVLVTGRVGTLGKLFVMKDRCWPSDNALVIKPKESEVQFQFLHYSVSTVIGQAVSLNRGAANPLLTQRDLGAIEIPWCQPEIQEATVAPLVGIDAKIVNNRALAADLEAMTRAIFKSWFVDFDPVRAKMDGRTPIVDGRTPIGMDAATAALFPDELVDSELGEIPKGWSPENLGKLITLAYGKALKKTMRKSGPVPVYGSGGITGWHSQPLVDEPSIIVGRKGTVGSLFWENRPFFPIDTVFYVTSDLPLVYVYGLLQTIPLRNMNTDAAVPGLNRNNVYQLRVAAPTAEVINTFTIVAASIREKIDALRDESVDLASLRDTLLPRLISGKLRVPEAQEIAEAAVA